jgi:uncharacterized membrane protein YgcG
MILSLMSEKIQIGGHMNYMNGSFRSKAIFTGICILFLPVLLAGCFGYGKLVTPKSVGMDITLDDVVENSPRYNIFYSGIESKADAVLFDPKDDPKRIQTSDIWKPIDKLETLYQILNSIQEDSKKSARFSAIRGADKHVYGFIYTHQRNTVKQVRGNQDAVEVYPDINIGITGGGSSGGEGSAGGGDSGGAAGGGGSGGGGGGGG